MSDNKEFVSQNLENGSIHISNEVIASIAAMAAQDVDGVYGLGGGAGTDLGMLKMRAASKDIHVEISDEDEISIDCYIIVLYGHSVVEVAKNVQDVVTSTVTSTTGRVVKGVNVSVSGISLSKEAKK